MTRYVISALSSLTGITIVGDLGDRRETTYGGDYMQYAYFAKRVFASSQG